MSTNLNAIYIVLAGHIIGPGAVPVFFYGTSLLYNYATLWQHQGITVFVVSQLTFVQSGPSAVFDQFVVLPLNSRISLSGGQLKAPVAQNAGQVPGILGALKSPLNSQAGNWSLITTCRLP